ncbi:MAG: dihydropteroate synthase [Syntrophomonadaceae bacterium]|nr:dihydropteroate synthase [Syntrophomonadaceae bacterium]
MGGHHIIEIRNQREAVRLLEQLGASRQSWRYMLPKADFLALRLKSIGAPAANIIKQEMLARGGEAVVWREAVLGKGEGDILLLGTRQHYELLLTKLKGQPFGLAAMAQEIKNLLTERKAFVMSLPHGRELAWGSGTLLMGIINRSPESFAHGGRRESKAEAFKRALTMVNDGADVIDVGGNSSRPGGTFVSAAEERRRVLPLVKALSQEGVIVSVDTFRAEVAEAAIDAGAHIINNIGMWQLDSGLLPLLARYGCPTVLMHNRLHVEFYPGEDVIGAMIDDLQKAVAQAAEAGLPAEKIILDPGFGFGLGGEEDRQILRQLKAFTGLGRPLLAGVSRKRFVGQERGLPPEERLEGSLAAMTLAINAGADMLRVHDVAAARRTANVCDEVLKIQ